MKQDNLNANLNGGTHPGGSSPQFNVLEQYIKDFSFENPNAPLSIHSKKDPPHIHAAINVNVQSISAETFVVDLHIEGNAMIQDFVLFRFELIYGGVFRLLNIVAEHVQPILMIECPRLLFPFARQIIATHTSQSGLPPFFLEPVDFVALYNNHLRQESQHPSPKSPTQTQKNN